MSFLERLKQKSEKEKRAIALGVSLIITFLIAALWLLARSAMQGL